jgi:hemoglobin
MALKHFVRIHHVERLAVYWAEVLGGPPRFSAECGGHSAALLMHAHNGDMGDLGMARPAGRVDVAEPAQRGCDN